MAQSEGLAESSIRMERPNVTDFWSPLNLTIQANARHETVVVTATGSKK
jgi:hypothetical protein